MLGLLNISLEGPFPNFIEFFNDHDVLFRQSMKYEWKLIKWSHCNMFGHEEINCKKKEGQRKEWRRVQKDSPQEANLHQATEHH